MSLLEMLQRDVAAYLNEDTFFDNIPIYAVRDMAIQGEADKVLAGLASKNGKAGTAVLVRLPILNCEKPESPGPCLKVSQIVEVQEIEAVRAGPRGSNVTAEDIAVHVLQVLHHFALCGLFGPLNPATDTLTPSLEQAPKLIYECHFTALFPINRIAAVQTPIISPSNGAATQIVTLTSGTAGAEIYYTTDETFPGPKNPAATLYSEPFAPNCAVLRAAAYDSTGALRGSDVNRAKYTL